MNIPLALKLLTAFYERAYPGMLGYFFCRFRFYDDVVKACLENNELDAIVNLGAGMDPRAYNLPGLEGDSTGAALRLAPATHFPSEERRGCRYWPPRSSAITCGS